VKKRLITLLLATATSCAAFAQSDATVSRLGDLQAGGGYSMTEPDYGPTNLTGFNIYSTFDFRSHLGIEADFRDTSAHNASLIYERTYEIGPRYFYHFGRFSPYAKVLIGRGVFNYPPDCLDKTTYLRTSCTSPNVDPATTGSAANLAYNMYALGAGMDIAVRHQINVRIDYEYQRWLSFQTSQLTPQVFSIGVAYHFGSGKLSIR
jgi:opacity protein-like surface antigen